MADSVVTGGGQTKSAASEPEQVEHQSPEPGRPASVRSARRLSIDQVAGLNTQLSSSPSSYRRKVSSTLPPFVNIPDPGSVNPGSQDIIKLKDPQILNRLWSRVLDPELGIALETHRYFFSKYPGTFQVQQQTVVEHINYFSNATNIFRAAH